MATAKRSLGVLGVSLVEKNWGESSHVVFAWVLACYLVFHGALVCPVLKLMSSESKNILADVCRLTLILWLFNHYRIQQHPSQNIDPLSLRH